MSTKYYFAVVDRAEGEDALGTAVEDMQRDGEALPRSNEDDAVPEYDVRAFHGPRTLLVPVEVFGKFSVISKDPQR